MMARGNAFTCLGESTIFGSGKAGGDATNCFGTVAPGAGASGLGSTSDTGGDIGPAGTVGTWGAVGIIFASCATIGGARDCDVWTGNGEISTVTGGFLTASCGAKTLGKDAIGKGNWGVTPCDGTRTCDGSAISSTDFAAGAPSAAGT